MSCLIFDTGHCSRSTFIVHIETTSRLHSTQGEWTTYRIMVCFPPKAPRFLPRPPPLFSVASPLHFLVFRFSLLFVFRQNIYIFNFLFRFHLLTDKTQISDKFAVLHWLSSTERRPLRNPNALGSSVPCLSHSRSQLTHRVLVLQFISQKI